MTSLKRVKLEKQRMINSLKAYCGLPENLIRNVLTYTQCLVKPETDYIDDLIFYSQMSQRFGITTPLMLENMYDALKKPRESHVTVESMSRCICMFLSDKQDLKSEFVFKVYDINRDGSLTILDFGTLLKPCVIGAEEPEESVKDLIDMVRLKLQLDGSTNIDIEEFKKRAKTNTLYLEFLGQCLPPDEKIRQFRQTMTMASNLQAKALFSLERFRSLAEPRPVNRLDKLYPIPLDLP